MIVVSDTSPISNLLAIDRLHLLPDVFSHVIIPTVVWGELSKLEDFGYDVASIQHASWLSIRTHQNQPLFEKLSQDLDPGEASAIALAVELKASLILIDEKPGRAIAKEHRLNPTGVLGILLRAKRSGFLQKVKPELDCLVHQARFFVSRDLYEHVLKLAGEP